MNRLKVKEDPYLFRDVDSNGIINTNDAEYNEYARKKKQIRILEEDRLNTEARLNKIESEVGELKQGINQILELLRR
jgi:hypothetical protein